MVIGGAGRVGSYLAGTLASRGHAVAVIEKDEKACWELATSVDAIVIQGDACDFRYQEDAEVGRADVFTAVTGDDDDNLVACQLARTSFGVPRLVARVNDPRNEGIFVSMGIDAVSSTTIIARLIEGMASAGGLTTFHMLGGGRLVMVELDIPPQGSRAIGRSVKELELPSGCVLVSISRGEEVIIPHGGDRMQPGDKVLALTTVDEEETLRLALVGSARPARRERRDA
ncbi:MAG: TrkA family potassium uptake protein [Actinobacteria bacterium]|nr:TrkA family potassium uptake protein [Actinomycetota bacterium]